MAAPEAGIRARSECDDREGIIAGNLLRSEIPLQKGYYQTATRQNKMESSILKLYDTSYESVFIADILEGLPKISDSIFLVSDERAAELDLNYTEATID